MGRMSKADRVSSILRTNPKLGRDDPRIEELIAAEAHLRKTQRAARHAPVTVQTGSGSTKRSPEVIAVEHAQTAVRQLRTELELDRINVRRNEQAGLKVKRSPHAERMLSIYGPDYTQHRGLLPGLAAGLAAFGITPEDMPEHSRSLYAADLEEQAGELEEVRRRIQDAGKL